MRTRRVPWCIAEHESTMHESLGLVAVPLRLGVCGNHERHNARATIRVNTATATTHTATPPHTHWHLRRAPRVPSYTKHTSTAYGSARARSNIARVGCLSIITYFLFASKWRGLLDEQVWKMIQSLHWQQVGCKKHLGWTQLRRPLPYRCVRIQMRCGVCVGLDASDGPLDAQRVAVLRSLLWSLLCVSVHCCNCCTLRTTNLLGA
jgi:hypothetical protein